MKVEVLKNKHICGLIEMALIAGKYDSEELANLYKVDENVIINIFNGASDIVEIVTEPIPEPTKRRGRPRKGGINE